jgi:Rad3-related DNA helicase
MEILISILIGVALMEGYAWLDPLAKWLIIRAARKLPEKHREAFTEQWTADVAAMPNSFAKLLFALRNCTLAINDIRQEIYRNQFEAMANESELLIDRVGGSLGEVLEKSSALLRQTESFEPKVISTFNQLLDDLQQRQHHDAKDAIDRVRALTPAVVKELSNCHASLEQTYTIFTILAAALHGPLARAADAHSRLKKRLLDDEPIDEDDQKLLKSLVARLIELRTTYDTHRHDHLLSPAGDSLSNVMAAVETIKIAVRELDHEPRRSSST